MAVHTFPLNADFIELHALLKVLGLAPSGGAAKTLVAEGQVRVDGEVETRKGRKLRAGQLVRVGGEEIRIVAGGTEE